MCACVFLEHTQLSLLPLCNLSSLSVCRGGAVSLTVLFRPCRRQETGPLCPVPHPACYFFGDEGRDEPNSSLCVSSVCVVCVCVSQKIVIWLPNRIAGYSALVTKTADCGAKGCIPVRYHAGHFNAAAPTRDKLD